ncbi:Rpn5 like 26S proteasomal regulatory subunit 12 [Cryptosporidium ryanae]|uniref:Rpn5 like 26S proteasomal regulatory subunit 12 n=1 Tax=Cryptosporidium ryanae TaxID=515981 RepID=UPI00351A6812|nr:Rpn5 like 26S proteasomal regulatory subunit 12 [Cryptosporidium ryanae]
MEDRMNDQFNDSVNPISELGSLVKDPKCTQDLTEETKKAISDIEVSGVNQSNYESSIELLLVIEKKCRQVSDSKSSCMILCKVISWILKFSNNIDYVLDFLQKISKKRGQLKKVISFIIQIFLGIINNSLESINPKLNDYKFSRVVNETKGDMDEYSQNISYNIKDIDECLKIIKTLDEIAKGKIYLELERARLMLILSNIKQEQNELKEASLLLEDISVETIGNMELVEKIQYVLEQMRLSLLCSDFVRLQIFAKKINPKIIEKFVDLKVIYYQYLIILWHHEQNPREISQCYLHILKSIISDDNNKCISNIPKYMKVPILKYSSNEDIPSISSCIEGFIIYLILDSYSSEISNEIKLFEKEFHKYIERNIPYCIQFISDYINQELIFFESTKTFNYNIPSYFKQLSNSNVFKVNKNIPDNSDIYYTEYKRCKINLFDNIDRYTLFLHRIQERNFVLISKYYKTISFERIQDLINLNEDELQAVINDLVEKKVFYAKINQPLKKIVFNNNNINKYNKFHHNIGVVLDQLDHISDLISNDLMIQQFNKICK